MLRFCDGMERREQTNRNMRMDAVMATAGDVAIAKLSTCQRGYYQDPFISHFSKGLLSLRTSASECLSIEPIIRRGTFARTCVMDRAIASFLSLVSSQQRTSTPQIVNLGCGRDTAFLRLWAGHFTTYVSDMDIMELRWYDIDYPPVIESKAELVRTCMNFPCSIQRFAPHSITHSSFHASPITPPSCSGQGCHLHSCDSSSTTRQSTETPYHLVGYDLSQSPNPLFQYLMERHSFDPYSPTLFVLECVHMYLQDDSSFDLLKTICTTCAHPFITLYDPILLQDSFGRVMEQHLIRRGVASPNMCLSKYTCIELLLEKMIQCGFITSVGCDMLTAWESILGIDNQRIASNLDRLDEMEEWNILMKHYCFLVAGGVAQRDDDDDDDSTSSRRLEQVFCEVGTQSILGFQEGRCLIKRKHIE